jgi:hypothetical protein
MPKYQRKELPDKPTQLVKSDTGSGKVYVERCTPDKWCLMLDSFLTYTLETKCYDFGVHAVQLHTPGASWDNTEIGLVHGMPVKKGNFIRVYFCPFCGGAVSKGSVSRFETKDGKPLKTMYVSFDENKEPVI